MGDFHTTSMCRFMVATQAALWPLATAPAATRHRRMQQSMSRKGDPYDNAVAENFFSCLKCELVHLHRYDSRRAAQADIFAYIEAFYNTLRPHSAIDWLSPCAFELRLRNASVA